MEDELTDLHEATGRKSCPVWGGDLTPFAMTASPATASPAKTTAAEWDWLSHTRGTMPTGGFKAQVWKSEQPALSKAGKRQMLSQGLRRKSHYSEEITGYFPAVAGSVRVTPLSQGPVSRFF